jgi:hypothetical protein
MDTTVPLLAPAPSPNLDELFDALDDFEAPMDFNPDEFNPDPAVQGKTKKPAPLVGPAAVLARYADELVSPEQLRPFIMSKLVEIANCGDIKHELRALELLGKSTDVGLFTERSETIIHHKTSVELEGAIRERIKNLLGHVVDMGAVEQVSAVDEAIDEEDQLANSLDAELHEASDSDEEEAQEAQEAQGDQP